MYKNVESKQCELESGDIDDSVEEDVDDGLNNSEKKSQNDIESASKNPIEEFGELGENEDPDRVSGQS